jgi:hypothetical protein
MPPAEQRKCPSPELPRFQIKWCAYTSADGVLADDAIGLHLVDGFERVLSPDSF